ncbi:hypothetical protein [Candidatus Hodgkinia cicadicola]|uniref:hypothetical protein n=1 Tax=Candidatus Hodgkinia cicadicola TaxID=573658 RepID=UPI0011BAC35A
MGWYNRLIITNSMLVLVMFGIPMGWQQGRSRCWIVCLQMLWLQSKIINQLNKQMEQWIVQEDLNC